MFDRSKCADHCLSIKRCSHFAWAANICWIKDIRGAPIVQIVDKNIPLCGFIPVSYFNTFQLSSFLADIYLIFINNFILILKCDSIQERNKATITKRPSSSNVSTKRIIGRNLTTSLSTNSSFISNQKKQNVIL